ncbi:unnamed protein product, partial [Prorocentrum cordatum]
MLRSAAPALDGREFARRWARAAEEPHRLATQAAHAAVAEQSRRIFCGATRSAAEAGARQWPKLQARDEKVMRDANLATLRPLWEPLRRLRASHARTVAWQERRRLGSLSAAPPPQVLLPESSPFSVFAARFLHQEIGLSIPLEMLVSFFKSAGSASHEGDALPAAVRPGLQLPVKVSVSIGELTVECTLESVASLEEQQISFVSAGGSVKRCSSMAEALRLIVQERGRHGRAREMFLPKVVSDAMSQQHGAWTLFRYQHGKKTSQLRKLVNESLKRGVPLFVNPPGMEPCPVLPAIEDLSASARLARDREEFRRALSVGQWVSCKQEGKDGVPGRLLNAVITGLDAGENSSGRPTHVDLQWAGGGVEREVPVSRLKKPTVWEQGGFCGYFDRGRWLCCQVEQVHRPSGADPLDYGQLRFEITLEDGRRLT